jgi:hypothetical protein
MRTHDSPSDHRRDLRRRVHFLEESRHPMPARAKHERLQQAKGKEVLQPLFENHGRNRREEGRASTVKIRNLSDESGSSTSTSHPRETHRCSKCHDGKRCPVLEDQQPPATKVKPPPIPSCPTVIVQTLASNRPHGPHIGEDGWDDAKWDHSTDDMIDDEEAPSRSHVDQLDKAGIWQDSSSPPRRPVLSPSAPQVSSPRPSVLTRLGDPPNILERLSVVLDRHSPVNAPTPSHVVTDPPIQSITSIMELDQQSAARMTSNELETRSR